MRLVSCYITGFGQMKDFSYEFGQGLDATCQENGWGKTTFSIFLKAMFYGMDYSARTKVLTERKHYLPWDGTMCGGHLVFETDHKTYRVERTFGRTDKEDTFKLIDVTTGNESSDFSTNLGEELFQVDRESFEKSIFIPQSAIATSMTDSLNAKMGDLAANKDDINNFDAAVNRVSELRKNYTRKSKVNNGKLNIIKDEISTCNEIVDKKTAIWDGYQKQLELLEEKKKKLDWMEAEKKRLAEKIRQQSKKEQDMGAYRQQLEFLTKQQEELNKLDDFFAAGLPSIDEQEKMEDIERQHDVSCRTESDLVLKLPIDQQIQKWESLFSEGVPSAQDIEEWNADAVHLQELELQGKHAQLSDEMSKQLEELKHFFSRMVPTEEELSQAESDVQELSKLEGRIVEQDENYHNLKARKDVASQSANQGDRTGSVMFLFALFVAFLVGAVAFRVFVPNSGNSIVLQVVCFVGAVASLVAGIMQHIRIRSMGRSRQDDLEQQLLDAAVALDQSRGLREELTDRVREFLSHFMLTPADSMQQMVYEIRVNLDHYLRLRSEEEKATASTTGTVEKLVDARMELYTVLNRFATVYDMDLYHDGCEIVLLEKLKKDVTAYEEYMENRKQMESLHVTMDKQKHLLEQYIGRFPMDASLSISDCLKHIRSNIEAYERAQESVQKLQDEVKQFADNNQVEEDSISVEELQSKQEQIDLEIHDIHKGITQDRDALLSLSDEMDTIEEAENRREVLLEERTECEKKIELLEKTEDFLQMAKEQFLSKYMGPLRKGMDHYMTLLDKKYKGEADSMDFDITMDLSIQVMNNGTTHSSDYLSNGYQDLVSLCARLALVDVIYRKEKPMIVLDDPFTNLDEEKIKRALLLLQEIGKERQIIYFTCHNSRMPK